MPEIFVHKQEKRQTRHLHWRRPFLVLMVGLVISGAINFFRPLPLPTVQLQLAGTLPASPVSISWPTGTAAVGANGFGLLASSNGDKTMPIASIAKVITALCVLEKYPLAPGQTGPILTMTDADVQGYNQTLAVDGSNVPVQAGEQLNEYQALEAMLLPSANNMADSLATWAFGSQSDYAKYANAFLKQHNLLHTTVGNDASGFDPSTTSSANDIVSLGLLAVQNPVLMQIVGEKQADLPVAGTVQNYNSVIGVNGINGIKTGNNEQNPGAFLFSATVNVDGNNVTVVGAVMDQADLSQALQVGAGLVLALQPDFEKTTVIQPGQTVGIYRAAWGAQVPIKAEKAVSFIRWKGIPSAVTAKLPSLRQGELPSTQQTMELVVHSQHFRVPVRGQTVPGPSFWWRLTRH